MVLVQDYSTSVVRWEVILTKDSMECFRQSVTVSELGPFSVKKEMLA